MYLETSAILSIFSIMRRITFYNFHSDFFQRFTLQSW